jgi:hypothetical protein
VFFDLIYLLILRVLRILRIVRRPGSCHWLSKVDDFFSVFVLRKLRLRLRLGLR